MGGEEKNKMWGTWEELLLAGAVERHGTKNWELISEELRARTVYVFSPEDCKAKYDVLRRRFNGYSSENPDHSNYDGNGNGNGNGNINSLLLEVLRERRINELKTKEIPLKNDSIGSLESEIRRLKAGEDRKQGSERSKDRSSAGSFTEAAAPDSAAGCFTEAEAPDGADTASPTKHQRIETVCEIDKGEGIQSDQIGGDRESNPLPAEKGSPKRDPDRNEEMKAAESIPIPVAVAVTASRTEGGRKNQQNQQLISEVHPSSPLDSFYGSSETLADEKENRRSLHDFVESKDSNIKARRLRTDLVQRKTDFRSSRRPATNVSHRVLMPHKPKTEDFDAEPAQRSNPQQNPEDDHAYPSSPVKSEPDRDGERNQDQVSIGCTENSELHTVDTNASERSSAPIRRRARRKQGKRNPAAFGVTTTTDSGTSRQKHNQFRIEEGSAESIDIEEKEFKGTRDDECLKGLTVDSDLLSSANPAEISTRQDTKAFSSSREASESGHRHGHGKGQEHCKESEEFMDAWNQTTRSSGDSHMEDRMEGTDDRMEGTDEIETSPMSRRSRREPKVPGKLLPLLECLRSITSHKFGPVFKHKRESQNKQQYRNMIRRHMDLGTIRAKLEEGSYSGSLEFFRDLLLVFNNALIFYPKTSQEHGAAWVLRQLANNEMAKIFQTEALLKQEGPSTRKRDPRAVPRPPVNATMFNPNSRRRNARPLLGGGRAVGRPKSTTRLNTREEKYNSQEPPPKEPIELSSSTGLKPEPEIEPEENFEAEATNISKIPKVADRKASGSNIQPKKGSVFHSDSKKSSNSEPKTAPAPISNSNTPQVESRNNSSSHGHSNHHHHNNNGRGLEQRKAAATMEEKDIHIPEPTHKQRSDREQLPPSKRGVGRPPKHAKRGADPPSKSSEDLELSSRPRKKLKK